MAVQINWGLAQPQGNAFGNFLSSFQAGQAVGKQNAIAQAMQGFDRDPEGTISRVMALDPEKGLELRRARAEELKTKQEADRLARNTRLGQAVEPPRNDLPLAAPKPQEAPVASPIGTVEPLEVIAKPKGPSLEDFTAEPPAVSPKFAKAQQEYLASGGDPKELEAYTKAASLMTEAQLRAHHDAAGALLSLAAQATTIRAPGDPTGDGAQSKELRKMWAMDRLPAVIKAYQKAHPDQDPASISDALMNAAGSADYSLSSLDAFARKTQATADVLKSVDDRNKQAAEQRNKDREFSETVRSHKANEAVAGGQLSVAQARAREEVRHNTVSEGLAAAKADGKPVPAAVARAHADNRAAIANVDDAIEAITKNPRALGWGNYFPEGTVQRADPHGVDVRAKVTNIGSQIRHDRSGAAVTAAETPYLKPFIPSSTDSAETAITKLKELRRRYAAEQMATEEEFSPDAGYKGFGTTKAPPAPAPQPQAAPTTPGRRPSLGSIFGR